MTTELAPENHRDPIRIAIHLPESDGFNVPALEYLLLHLNTRQRIFEFEFIADPRPEVPNILRPKERRSAIDAAALPEEIARFRAGFVTAWNEELVGYGLAEEPLAHVICITLRPLSDHWYSKSFPGISVISLANWRRRMAPPSILEFVTTLVLMEALCGGILKGDEGYGHLGTKGCIGDFNAQIRDVRYKVLNGFICAQCRKRLSVSLSEKDLNDLEGCFGRAWLGKVEDPLSPAATVKKLGYDLFVSRGASATWYEFLYSLLRNDVLKELVKLVLAILLAVLLARLRLGRN